jgi:hypothetical protein
MRTQEEVSKAFEPNEQLSAPQKFHLMAMTKSFQELASEIVQNVPESADRTAALRKLLEAKFSVMHAISHGSYAVPETKKEVKNEQAQNQKAPQAQNQKR